MIKRVLVTTMVLGAFGAPLAAQEMAGAELVRTAMATYANGKYLPGFCSVNKGLDNRATYATTQFKIALEDKNPEKRTKALQEAVKNSAEALTKNPKVAGHWYYYGRIALFNGDVAGADSALTKAVELASDCETDIDAMRQAAWAPVTNAAIDALNEQKNDEAIGLFRTANLLFRKRPEALTRLGAAYANIEQTDSAIVYLKAAIAVAAADTSMAAEGSQASLFLANMYQRKDRHAEAVPLLEGQLKTSPTDVRVMRALAASYRATDRADDASKLEAQSRELGMAKAGEEGVGASEIFSDGVALFNEKKYAEAAELFGKVLELEPYNRDALFNQANAYLGGGDSKGLVRVARILIEREPYGEVNHRLLIQGLRDLKEQDEVLKAAEVYLPLPINVEVKTVSNAGEKGGAISGVITGREAKDLTGKVIPGAPMALVFSFIDNTGSVVATADVAVPALEIGATHDFRVDSQGTPWIGYRYAKK